jgi:hypothetical protein
MIPTGELRHMDFLFKAALKYSNRLKYIVFCTSRLGYTAAEF